MCSYPNDGGTDGRLNRGCGCAIGIGPNVAPSACSNQDPSTGREYPRNDSHIAACHCQPDDPNPTTCYFEGPAFYHGAHGADELHEMLKTRLRLQEEDVDLFAYNELVLDELLQHEFMRDQGPGSIIQAFVVPLNARCGDSCVSQLHTIRDRVKQDYGGDLLPVIGFDFTATTSPFKVYDVEAAPSLFA